MYAKMNHNIDFQEIQWLNIFGNITNYGAPLIPDTIFFIKNIESVKNIKYVLLPFKYGLGRFWANEFVQSVKCHLIWFMFK
jgi:hypothetical protein